MMESKNPPFVTRLQLLMSELSSDRPPASSGWTLNIPEWEDLAGQCPGELLLRAH